MKKGRNSYFCPVFRRFCLGKKPVKKKDIWRLKELQVIPHGNKKQTGKTGKLE